MDCKPTTTTTTAMIFIYSVINISLLYVVLAEENPLIGSISPIGVAPPLPPLPPLSPLPPPVLVQGSWIPVPINFDTQAPTIVGQKSINYNFAPTQIPTVPLSVNSLRHLAPTTISPVFHNYDSKDRKEDDDNHFEPTPTPIDITTTTATNESTSSPTHVFKFITPKYGKPKYGMPNPVIVVTSQPNFGKTTRIPSVYKSTTEYKHNSTPITSTISTLRPIDFHSSTPLYPHYHTTSNPNYLHPIEDDHHDNYGKDGFQRDYFPVNIIDILRDENVSRFIKLLDDVQLLKELKNRNKKFTIFAPTNKGFNHLDSDTLNSLTSNDRYLREVLMNHLIIGEEIKSKYFESDKLLSTSLRPNKLRLNVDDIYNVTYVNGAEIIKPDNIASNGIVHLINDVIYPDISIGNMYHVLRADGRFKILLKVSDIAGLHILDNNLETITLFAPTDGAFDSLPFGELDKLMRDRKAIRNFIKRHIYPGGTKVSAELAYANLPSKLKGHQLSLRLRKGRVRINDQAVIIDGDIFAGNGIIQVIDAPLYE